MSDSLWPLNCSTPGFPVLHYLPEFAQIHDHWVSDALQPSRLLLPPSPTSLNLSQHQGIFLMMQLFTSGGQSIGAPNLASIIPSIRISSNESALRIRWPKYWSFSFSISSSSEYSGLISFRIDWFDLIAVQGTLKSLLQHHSSKASILWCSALFMVQLSHPYMTTGKWKC